jgi:hypothetical protein
MTPSSSIDERIEQLSADLDRVSAHTARTMRYYDEAPDGSAQKHDALATLDRLNRRRNEIERELDTLID